MFLFEHLQTQESLFFLFILYLWPARISTDFPRCDVMDTLLWSGGPFPELDGPGRDSIPKKKNYLTLNLKLKSQMPVKIVQHKMAATKNNISFNI